MRADGAADLFEVGGSVLVRCPGCGRAATLRLEPEEVVAKWIAASPRVRLVCPSCGRSKEWRVDDDGGLRLPAVGTHLDYFDLELWLQVPCHGAKLWAYNADDLVELEGEVERKPGGRRAGRRLPRWARAIRNRMEILRSLAALRALLPSRERAR